MKELVTAKTFFLASMTLRNLAKGEYVEESDRTEGNCFFEAVS